MTKPYIPSNNTVWDKILTGICILVGSLIIGALLGIGAFLDFIGTPTRTDRPAAP